ncbi:MAG: amidohydrolase family protein [Chitinophagales bacterium]|nr:amidohydrolase family protein [Chitinophagales bacterium]MDW8393210.1 amidohydrolase family protein [Chitinophagales bacterium]
MINSHTHIFNVKCAPDRFYGLPVARFFSLVPQSARTLAKWFRRLYPWSDHDLLERYARMLEVGSERRQQDIFERLLDHYAQYPHARMVVLTLDMDFMGAGEAVNNYLTQLCEVAEVKARYPEQMIAFFCADPRRPDLMRQLREFVPGRGFTGIKLYPALGFYPFDPALRPVYEYAVAHQLPIVVHCDTGGIFYRGPLTAAHLRPPSLNPAAPSRDFTAYASLKPGRFKDLFTDPAHFTDVLELSEFRSLKLCFAHFGGKEMIEEHSDSVTGSHWYLQIKEYMRKYPNVYADISYTLRHTSGRVRDRLRADMQDPLLGSRILFGTDYYMTVREKEEPALVREFLQGYGLDEAAFQQLAVINNRRFVSTSFYRP